MTTNLNGKVLRRFKMSRREIDIARLLHLHNYEIAERLGTSQITVRNQIHDLFAKFGARTRVELYQRICECGQVSE